MESNPSHSRPPSVDSVNLGSAYSGYFPSLNHNSHLPQTNIPSQYPQHAYQVPYSVPYPQSQSYQQQSYVAGNNTTAPLNYDYSIQAQAAAAAAFSSYQLQQNRHQQQPPSHQQQRQFQPIHPQQPTVNYMPAVQWPIQNSQQYLQQQQQQQPQQQQHPQAYVNPQQANFNYSQYATDYYIQYYRLLHQQQQLQKQAQVRQRTPLKYGSTLAHTPAAFSNHDNRLLVGQPHARVALYDLREIFNEQCYPHLFLHSLLLHVNDDKSSEKTLLPFDDAQVALDWIRIKLLNDSNMNYELKLILKVITMLYRQNGVVSGLDLSELLFEIVTGGANNETVDSATDKLSQSGSDQVSQNKETLLSHLRQLLMRGQRRVAITFAQNNGLFDHAIALAYLISFQNGATQTVDNGLLISTIRKFISSTLSSTDPLFVFYSHLLQIATNFANSSNSSAAPIPNSSNAKIESLESFIILLANDIKFDKVEITNNSLRNLIDLMIALLKNDYDYVLSDDLFNERFDCLLVNECFEFARFRGNRLNPRLLLRKLEFAFELFDYGFVQHALNYCGQIRTKLNESSLDLKSLQENASHLRASRFANFLLPLNNLTGSEEENREFVVNLWFYQMLKMVTRFDSTQSFDSPLIQIIEEVEEENETDDEDDEEGDEDDEDIQIEKEEIKNEPVPQKANISKTKPVVENKIEPKVINKSKNVQNKSDSPDHSKKVENKQIEKVAEIITNNNEINQSNINEDSFNISPNQLNSTLLNSDSNHVRNSLTSGALPPITNSPMVANSLNHNSNEVVNSSIDDSSSNPSSRSTTSQFSSGPEQQFGNLLESRIIPNFNSNQVYDQQSLQSQPSQPEVNSFQGQFNHHNANTSPQSDMFNQNYGPNARVLNRIDESTLEHSDSFDSNQASLPHSPVKKMLAFNEYYAPNDTAFKMNSLQSSLPTGVDSNDSTQNDSGHSSLNNNNSMPFFAPPPSTFDNSAPVFDFMSSGQVTSIPTFDPISLDDNDSAFNQNNGRINNSNYPPQNNSTQANNKPEPNKDQKGSDTTKNSPSKNTGLFNTIFGKFKAKNQAILPDDKDPSIVFDPVKKQWVDKNAGDQGGVAGVPPPPPRIPMSGNATQSEPNSTLTSPLGQFPSSPSFSSFEPNQPPPSLGAPSPVPNGTLPSLPSLPSLQSNSNQFRGGIRKNRYIDVFHAQPNSTQNKPN